MICKIGKHQYVQFDNRRTEFVPSKEFNTKYGVCVKCGNYIQGHLSKPKV